MIKSVMAANIKLNIVYVISEEFVNVIVCGVVFIIVLSLKIGTKWVSKN